MIKLFYFLFFSLWYFISCAQPAKTEAACRFQSDGSGKAEGLKISISYPCSYIAQDGIIDPNTIKKFSKDKGKMVIMLGADVIPDEAITDFRKDFNQASFSRQLSLMGSLETTDSVIIQSTPFIEAVYTTEDVDAFGNTFFTKYLSYYGHYKNYFVMLMYAAHAASKKEVEIEFGQWLQPFRALAKETHFIN